MASNWLAPRCLIGWSKYRRGLPSTPLHYGLTWPVGIPIIFLNNSYRFSDPVIVPLHSPTSRQMPADRAVQGDCEGVYNRIGFCSDSLHHVSQETLNYKHGRQPWLKKEEADQTDKARRAVKQFGYPWKTFVPSVTLINADVRIEYQEASSIITTVCCLSFRDLHVKQEKIYGTFQWFCGACNGWKSIAYVVINTVSSDLL